MDFDSFDKFVKHLSKEVFTLDEVRKFIDSDFVLNVSKLPSDDKYKNFVKYSVKLADGDVYFVYVLP